MSLHRSALVGASALLLASTACDSASVPSAAAPPTTASASATGSGADLAAETHLLQLLPAVPSGSSGWHNDTRPPALFTPDQFVTGFFSADRQDTARATVKQTGLRFGVRRGWCVPAGCTEVVLLSYASPSGAQTSYSAQAANAETFAEATSPISGIPRGEILTHKASARSAVAELRAIAQAGRVVISVEGAAEAQLDVDGASGLVRQIYQQVCAQESC